MKLAAIYNVWGDDDLLKLSIENIKSLVDVIIVVFSTQSNFGEYLNDGKIHPERSLEWMGNIPIISERVEPNLKLSARDNETLKRNEGLRFAREAGCTHFLTMDADEFYEHEPFLKAKEMFHVKPDLQGLVCICQTYFRSPHLTIGLDTTLVPFIHVLTPKIRHEFNKSYPFAWINKQIRIDPTRSLNINSGVERIDLVMHHYSWIRKDFKKKIRNSTARANLERSCILNSLLDAKEGGYCEYYQKTLVRASVDFNIPEYEFDQSGNAAVRQDL